MSVREASNFNYVYNGGMPSCTLTFLFKDVNDCQNIKVNCNHDGQSKLRKIS